MEEQIIKLFLTKNKLKFNEIEKSLGVRSNKLDYHLKKLLDEGVISKNNGFYELSETSEYLIPYVSDKKSVLPVVLICMGDSKRVFLYKRHKRPYKNFLSLPGGRLLLGESISNCTKRIMKEKHKINAEFEKINSISLEHVKKNKKIIHSFLLIFVNAKIDQDFEFVDVDKNKSKIIPSDYKLIKQDFDSEIEIKTINSRI